MTMHDLVHCHICPLKDCCKSGNPDASWRWHNQGEWRRGEQVEPKDSDFTDLHMATAHCPLRRATAYVDSKLSKELLKKL